MTFIKIGNLVINTNYIAAIKLDDQAISEEDNVSILLSTPEFPVLQLEASSHSPYHYEWLDFTGEEARCLREYFSNFNIVVDLSFRD